MSVVPTCGQNPRHTDLHPRIDVCQTSWFILSVWYLTGGDMSVVPTCVWEPSSQGPPRTYPTSWFILFVLFLTGIEMCVIATHVRYLLLHGTPPW